MPLQICSMPFSFECSWGAHAAFQGYSIVTALWNSAVTIAIAVPPAWLPVEPEPEHPMLCSPPLTSKNPLLDSFPISEPSEASENHHSENQVASTQSHKSQPWLCVQPFSSGQAMQSSRSLGASSVMPVSYLHQYCQGVQPSSVPVCGCLIPGKVLAGPARSQQP